MSVTVSRSRHTLHPAFSANAFTPGARHTPHERVDCGFSAVRVSTGEGAESKPTEIVREHYGRTIMRCEIEPLGDAPVRMDASLQAVGDLGIAHVAFSGGRLRRTPQLLFDDTVVLSRTLAGSRIIGQRGREVVVAAGEAILTSGAEVLSAIAPNARFIAIRLPSRLISRSVPDLHDRVARVIRRDTAPLRLLTTYAGALQDARTLAAPELRQSILNHICELVGLTLGATGDAAEAAKSGGVRAALLHAIKTDVTENLAREGLSVATVAARHRLTVRYLQRLFEHEGTTFTAFLLAARLACAHRLLTNARSDKLTISTIAINAGFGNLSHFNHCFRRRYGASPSDVRAQTRGERG
jgi:AraC-like DNA-binding protein